MAGFPPTYGPPPTSDKKEEKMKFDELVIGEKFKLKGRRWEKASMFAAKCLSKNSPFDADALIAIDRRERVELEDSAENLAKSVFRRKR